jgi:hypothetical protein
MLINYEIVQHISRERAERERKKNLIFAILATGAITRCTLIAG